MFYVLHVLTCLLLCFWSGDQIQNRSHGKGDTRKNSQFSKLLFMFLSIAVVPSCGVNLWILLFWIVNVLFNSTLLVSKNSTDHCLFI